MEKSNRLFEKIAADIRKKIENKTFPSGTKLPSEPALMEFYNVGRSTIREAIKSLTLSGILTVQQGLGTIINEIPSEPLEQRLRGSDFEDINYVRAMLEREIVALCALNRNDEDLKEMEAALTLRKQCIEKGKRQECIAADVNFHLAIAKGSGNTVLFDLYKSFTNIIKDFFSRREPAGITHFAMSHHLHQDLHQAILQQNTHHALSIITNILNNNH
ncbi:transcriptional regulator [Pedobacter ginsenosidimutans]|uniref:Transcriptional regulator n=1 Tax=Pedobacter ginsenosidimutans TaxID=687842 RepID=A0A0T5VVD0_9SPHI|nr:FCD domain-containing protein [Pedobacter ginsenosidimutans]KRT17760.1 transcriptional regulator [Pedobacter ginsenosidimutans]